MSQCRLWLGALLLAAGLAVAFEAAAQSVTDAWILVRGKAQDIAVGGDGTVVAVDPAGWVYKRDSKTGDWRSLGRGFARIAVAPDGTPWAVDQEGVLRRYDGSAWRAIGKGAVDLAVGGDGSVAVATNSGKLARYDPESQSWTALEGNGLRVAADSDGRLWSVAADGAIARRLGDAWIGVIGLAKDIAADESGRVIMLGANGKLYEWLEDTATWTEISGTGVAIAISVGGGQLWRVDADNSIFAQGIEGAGEEGTGELVSSRPGGGSTLPAEIPDLSPITFFDVDDGAERLEEIAIGADGSIFGLTSSGAIRRWSNTNDRFKVFPGTLNTLAVDAMGLPLGIGSRGRLVRHDGVAWRGIRIGLALGDLTIAPQPNGVASVLDAEDRPFRLGNPLSSFARLPGIGQQIAGAPEGFYWLVDSAGRIFQCDPEVGCNRQPLLAIDIDIGPAGSVFIVDNAFSLRRFNPTTGQFDIIRRGDTVRVAVGPRDRPWIIDRQGRVFASQFFERDESGDDALAVATRLTADVTESRDTAPVLEVSRSISFFSVDIPTSAPGFPDLGEGMLDITAGRDDVIIATGFNMPCVLGNGRNWAFNPLGRRWNHMRFLEDADFLVAVAARRLSEGTAPPANFTPRIPAFYGILTIDCTDFDLVEFDSRVFVAANFASRDFTEATLFALPTGAITPDLDIAADDTIVFVTPTGGLEFFETGNPAGVMTRADLTFVRVGVGATIDVLWVVDAASNVYEFDPVRDSFILRSQQANDRALDVGVGHDGTVFIVDLSGTLKQWDPTSRRFITITRRNITRVAVDSRGNPIVADFPDSQRVFFGR